MHASLRFQRAFPDHFLEFDHRRKDAETIEADSFEACHSAELIFAMEEDPSLSITPTPSPIGDSSTQAITRKGAVKEHLLQVVSVTSQVAVSRRVRAFELATRSRQETRARQSAIGCGRNVSA